MSIMLHASIRKDFDKIWYFYQEKEKKCRNSIGSAQVILLLTVLIRYSVTSQDCYYRERDTVA